MTITVSIGIPVLHISQSFSLYGRFEGLKLHLGSVKNECHGKQGLCQ